MCILYNNVYIKAMSMSNFLVFITSFVKKMGSSGHLEICNSLASAIFSSAMEGQNSEFILYHCVLIFLNLQLLVIPILLPTVKSIFPDFT